MLAPLTQSEPVRWYVKDEEARQSIYRKLMARRRSNAMARIRGFRNYAEMCGDDE
ncbi:MAG: hypothetical protein NT113_13285 [Hyphomicrobiales bacterium]|nr:hypothetical protein [Hyphomicrobiales bacterium]